MVSCTQIEIHNYFSNVKTELPFNDYLEYYGPEYRLHITPTNMENLNTTEYLESCT